MTMGSAATTKLTRKSFLAASAAATAGLALAGWSAENTLTMACADETDGVWYRGLETTMCQLACPNRAITVGDLDDPESKVSQLIAKYGGEQWMPEAGTAPQAYYFDSVPKQQI